VLLTQIDPVFVGESIETQLPKAEAKRDFQSIPFGKNVFVTESHLD